MKSICFVLPYFGKFNGYWPLYLRSCADNPTVDWLVYTDCGKGYSYPANVHVVDTTFEEFRRRFEDFFGFPISLDRPYKLCDFKPAYGEVLHGDLLGYDFWGHIDCDMVLGDVRRFITDGVLDANDKILSRGHMSIYRNTEETNSFYRTQRLFPHEAVLGDPGIHAFDEWGGVSQAYAEIERERERRFFDEFCFDDVKAFYDGFRLTREDVGLGSPYHRDPGGEPARCRRMSHVVYEYADGRLFRLWLEGGSDEVHREETMYAHFQKRQMGVAPGIVAGATGRFLVVPDEFVPYEEPTAAFLRAHAPGRRTPCNAYRGLRRNAWKVKRILSGKAGGK